MHEHRLITLRHRLLLTSCDEMFIFSFSFFPANFLREYVYTTQLKNTRKKSTCVRNQGKKKFVCAKFDVSYQGPPSSSSSSWNSKLRLRRGARYLRSLPHISALKHFHLALVFCLEIRECTLVGATRCLLFSKSLSTGNFDCLLSSRRIARQS